MIEVTEQSLINFYDLALSIYERFLDEGGLLICVVHFDKGFHNFHEGLNFVLSKLVSSVLSSSLHHHFGRGKFLTNLEKFGSLDPENLQGSFIFIITIRAEIRYNYKAE